MRKTLIAILMALALVVIPVGSAFADDFAEVTVSATPNWVLSIDVTSATGKTYDFETVYIDTDEDTGINYFTLQNDSTVNINVDIQCTATWVGSPEPANSWIYGAPAADQAQLKAGVDDADDSFDVTVQLDPAGPDPLYTTTTPGEDFYWGLQLDAPTNFHYADEQTCVVTLSAAQSD